MDPRKLVYLATIIFSKLAQYGFEGWPVLEWECALNSPEDGAREGAPSIRDHIIRVTDSTFDAFACGGDQGLARRMLGLDWARARASAAPPGAREMIEHGPGIGHVEPDALLIAEAGLGEDLLDPPVADEHGVAPAAQAHPVLVALSEHAHQPRELAIAVGQHLNVLNLPAARELEHYKGVVDRQAIDLVDTGRSEFLEALFVAGQVAIRTSRREGTGKGEEHDRLAGEEFFGRDVLPLERIRPPERVVPHSHVEDNGWNGLRRHKKLPPVGRAAGRPPSAIRPASSSWPGEGPEVRRLDVARQRVLLSVFAADLGEGEDQREDRDQQRDALIG